MERRQFLAATGAAAATALAGCLGGGATGTLATRVSDRPGDIDDFESCVVTIDAIVVKPTDGEETTVEVDDAEADLVGLQGDRSTLVDETELETGEYEYLKVSVAGVDATRSGGGEATVETPGDAPLKFNSAFEVRADTTTSFTADFTPVKQGQSGGYVVQPVAEEVTVTHGDDGSATNESSGGATNESSAAFGGPD